MSKLLTKTLKGQSNLAPAILQLYQIDPNAPPEEQLAQIEFVKVAFDAVTRVLLTNFDELHHAGHVANTQATWHLLKKLTLAEFDILALTLD